MACFICGETRNVKFRKDLFKYICAYCSPSTPRKVNREAFDKRYWGEIEKTEKVPESVKREFYSDYLSSSDNLEAYIAATSSKVA